MIHRQEGIDPLQVLWRKRGVGGQRPGESNAPFPTGVQHRSDDLDFLAPHVPALTGMGVQSQHRNVGLADGEIVLQIVSQDFDGLAQQGGINGIADRA